MVSFTTVPETLAAYERWLTQQPLSNHTRRTYLTQVKKYCTYLSTFPWEYGHPLQEPHARDYAVRDYKTVLKVAHLARPSSVNLALAAVDHFYRFLQLPTPHVAREDLPAQAPRALEPPEQKRFLRAVERCSSVRDRAIALLLFYTGLRISECAALTVDDVRLSSRKGLVTVRMGKGNTYREVPLNTEVRTARARKHAPITCRKSSPTWTFARQTPPSCKHSPPLCWSVPWSTINLSSSSRWPASISSPRALFARA